MLVVQPATSFPCPDVLDEAEISARFRPFEVAGYGTGALDILLPSRRVLSVPSQLGCRVGCTFCISSSRPVVRNLRAEEMLGMVASCLDAQPAGDTPLELSFTGEGEPVLNWKAAAEACRRLPALSGQFTSVRYCFSGLGAASLLEKLDAGPYPCRLQFSLHTARQGLRDRLIPRSEPLATIKSALLDAASRFASIELNVVLQAGVNDTEEDLQALLDWVEPGWPVVLNPLLMAGDAVFSDASDRFVQALAASGVPVRRYRKVAQAITRAGVYPLLTARPLTPT